MEMKEVKTSDALILHAQGLLKYHQRNKDDIEQKLEGLRTVLKIKNRRYRMVIDFGIVFFLSIGMFASGLWILGILEAFPICNIGLHIVKNRMDISQFKNTYPVDIHFLHEKRRYLLNNILEYEREIHIQQTEIEHLQTQILMENQKLIELEDGSYIKPSLGEEEQIEAHLEYKFVNFYAPTSYNSSEKSKMKQFVRNWKYRF